MEAFEYSILTKVCANLSGVLMEEIEASIILTPLF